MPSTVTGWPGGLDFTVTWMANCEKLAVSKTGEDIVTDAGFENPVYAPVPRPFHWTNEYAGFGMPVIVTALPLSCQSLWGVTDPPRPATVVRKYCFRSVTT